MPAPTKKGSKSTDSYTNIKDIIWLAGFLEGEGSFMYCRGTRSQPQLRVSSVDMDIMQKAARILHSKIEGPYQYGHKPFFVIRVHSCNAIAWMMTLYILMGKRRRQ